MTEGRDNVFGMDPLNKALRLGEVTMADAERRVTEAKGTVDRISQYLQVLRLVQSGASSMQANGQTRGFFVRSYARRLDTPSPAYQFEEFHIPVFSTDAAVVARLPEALRGTEEDILHESCPNRWCQNGKAYVVGVLSTNRGGYHRPASAVTFFVVCPHCLSANIIANGLPAETSSDDSAQSA